LVIIGGDENVHPADTTNTTYAIVDATHFKLVGRARTDGTIGVAAIDDARGRLYLTVTTLPTRASGSTTSYHDTLWAVDLRSGKLISKNLFYEGEQENLIGMAVDPGTGHVFIAAVRPTTQTYELLMIDPAAMAIKIQSLNGVPNLVFNDSTHHRVVVALQVGTGAQAVSYLDAFDSKTERLVWAHQLQFLQLQFLTSTYAATGVQYDPVKLLAWILAPGGLVTRLDIGRGVVDREFRVGYLAKRAWTQTGGFAIDMSRNRSYASWMDASGTQTLTCFVPRTDTAQNSHPFISYTGSCGQPTASLLAVDQLNGNIVTADTNMLRIFSGKNSAQVASYSLVDPVTSHGSTWVTSATVYGNKHCFAVLIGDVNYYNDATGALTQGAAEFIPIS
jgi:hypothetical protein